MSQDHPKPVHVDERQVRQDPVRQYSHRQDPVRLVCPVRRARPINRKAQIQALQDLEEAPEYPGINVGLNSIKISSVFQHQT